MRICLFTATFLPRIGGHEMAVDALARAFGQLGHQAIVLAQHASRRGTPDGQAFPYTVERFAKPFSQFWGLGTLRFALRELHRGGGFDVLHSFSSYPTGFVAAGLRAELNLPVIITSQGGDLADNSRFSKRRFIMKRIRKALGEADAVTAISAYMKERALAICPECAPRLREIPNGVNCAMFGQRVEMPGSLLEERLAPQKYFLFLGRLHRRKGVDVLIEAFRQSADSLGGLVLAIAGDGVEMPGLRAQAEVSGVADRIRFLGMVEGAAKLWLLQNALCLVAPTRTWEGMPVGVLEAMAAGCPVVGTEVGGITDLIRPDREGLLVLPEDPHALGRALVRMAGDPALRASAGLSARQAAQRYDWENVAREYLVLFDELVAAKAR